MPEAVIVDALRTPIGRAFKGSLTQVRPDDMTAFVVDKLLERNPDVDPGSVEDLICGCGMTQGEQAFNIGRISVLLSEKLPDSVTGATSRRAGWGRSARRRCPTPRTRSSRATTARTTHTSRWARRPRMSPTAS